MRDAVVLASEDAADHGLVGAAGALDVVLQDWSIEDDGIDLTGIQLPVGVVDGGNAGEGDGVGCQIRCAELPLTVATFAALRSCTPVILLWMFCTVSWLASVR